MIYLPVTFLLFALLILLLPLIWFAVTVDVIEVAVAKLGFSPDVALVLLLAVLIGGAINIPLYRVKTETTLPHDFQSLWLQQFMGIPLHRIQQETIVAINLGGGVIPVGLAIYQLWRVNWLSAAMVTGLVTVVSYYGAKVVPGIGIQMNPLIAPLSAATGAILLGNPATAPAIAFAGGVLGTLIGADLLHLPEIERMSTGILSIGGAGVFDGIALCGLFALLLT
ncbi:MAG: DUF1614 domain-containing protein [Almyronema sp.]